MQTVTVRLSGEDFATAIVGMRDWLEKNRCEPVAYRYEQDEDAVVVSVNFTADTQAKAFAKHFDGQSGDQRPVSRELSDPVGITGIGGV